MRGLLRPQVLEDLIAENDSVPEVWHLLGLAYYSGGHLEEAAEVGGAGQRRGWRAGERVRRLRRRRSPPALTGGCLMPRGLLRCRSPSMASR